MASQDPSSAIPLVHAADGIGYRLMELPAELVDDHSQYAPPTLHLVFVSSLTNRWSISSSSADGLARLRAAGKTYALRQKNTSNALVLLQAASSSPTEEGLKPTVSAIATVHETVELIEEKEETASQAAKPIAAVARGKWHEKFGKTR